MITDRISIPSSLTEPEDYLSTSLGVIFPDDINNQHGDASCPVTYSSPRYGDVFLQLADPQGERNRRLFSHHLWNAGVQLSALIEDGDVSKNESYGRVDSVGNRTNGDGDGRIFGDKLSWSVNGERVLELGAGTGLAGIIAARAGAREVVITDYPAKEVLANLRVNVRRNLGGETAEEVGDENENEQNRETCWVIGHEWGCVPDRPEDKEEEIVEQQSEENGRVEGEHRRAKGAEAASTSTDTINTEVGSTATTTATTSASTESAAPQPSQALETPRAHFATTNARAFDIILAADCLWMPDQHENLRRSISWFLAPAGRAWVVAGFHSGRAKMAGFFGAAALRRAGLRAERLWERDATGVEREWVPDRGVEDPTARKRWLVIAVLKRWEG